ncbi:MAG: PLP-dependent aminotransferase family protein [Candidatus Sumerlaeia bacterium]|nr:PLP-dependent aminotransferase family protein [Candidatus Sumerlaeia bacterium]
MELSTQGLPLSQRAMRANISPISWLLSKALEHPNMISLAAGFVDGGGLPSGPIARICAELLADGGRSMAALNYGTTAGSPLLRELLAEQLRKEGLSSAKPEDLIISNGGQQSLFTLTDATVDPGDIVLVEDPTYFVYLDVLRAAGARVIGVTTDEYGLVPEALEERLEELHQSGERHRLRLIYLMSYYTNPKGVNLPWERRKRIDEIVRAELERGDSFLVVEDAAYRELRLEGPDEPFLKSLDPENERIIVVGTFSKAFAPGLRLGWCMGPPWVLDRMARLKGNQDFGSSNFSQAIMAHAMQEGSSVDAAENFRSRYRSKRDALVNAMREFWPPEAQIIEPHGGLYAWASLPGIDTDPESEFFNRLFEKEVLYVPGKYCFCEETQGPRPKDSMRLSYGVASEELLREGARRMGEVIADMMP